MVSAAGEGDAVAGDVRISGDKRRSARHIRFERVSSDEEATPDARLL